MHTSVLFVDDEPLILSLYEALSPDLGTEFSVDTARDGNEALRLLGQKKYEIIVSDLEMPEMAGSELLTHVERRFPEAMRVVISGYDDELHVARCLTFGHRYLRKPISLEALAETLRRLSTLRNALSENRTRALLSSSSALPAPPETYVQLSEALQQNETSSETFAAIIESDSTLCLNLLEAVNSEEFGLSVNIASIHELFEVLGVHVIRGMILGLHTRNFFEERAKNLAIFQELWRHSLQTASAARKLASLERYNFRDCQTCYVAGLLHDIGKFIVAARADESASSCRTLVELERFERGELQVNHAVLGAYLLGSWGLPEAVVTTAELHHSLEIVPESALFPILYVHAAQSLIPHRPAEIDLEFVRRAGKEARVATWSKVLGSSL